MNWSIQLPNGDFLDTPPDFSIQFEMNNLVFSTSDTAVLPGSYSFPVEVPLTPRMKAQLGFPQRVDRSVALREIPGVWIAIGGVRIFEGTLKVTKSLQEKASITVYADFLGDLKKKNLADLDFGAPISVGGTSEAAWAAHMKATADEPEDFNHIFFPVYASDSSNWLNKWNPAAATFDPTGSAAIVPFVKAAYILERIFSNVEGYALQNKWQNTEELQRRYVFHNGDVKILGSNPTVPPTYPSEISLQKHVPRVSVPKFLRTLCAQNCLGIFVNPFDRTVRIAPLHQAIGAGAAENWTDYAVADAAIEDNADSPGYLNYAQPYEEIPTHFPAVESVEAVYNTLADFNADWQNLPTGYAYVEAGETMIEVRDDGIVVTLQRGHPMFRGVGDAADDAIRPEMEPFRSTLFGSEGEYYVFRQGRPSAFENNSGTYEWSQQEPPFAILQYRGIQVQKAGEPAAPLACNHVWLSYNTGGVKSKITAGGTDLADSDRSLQFFGEHGLHAQAWGRWLTMLQTGKHVTQTFILPISVLTAFSFDLKIRVGNMDFFAKRLRVQKLHDRGRVQVEASLVSVI